MRRRSCRTSYRDIRFLRSWKTDPTCRKESAGSFVMKTNWQATKLTPQIEEALRNSRYLIVVCSPNSAKSKYVNEEIEYFKSLGGETKILPYIIAGKATTDEDPDCCYAPALKENQKKYQIVGGDAQGKRSRSRIGQTHCRNAPNWSSTCSTTAFEKPKNANENRNHRNNSRLCLAYGNGVTALDIGFYTVV